MIIYREACKKENLGRGSELAEYGTWKALQVLASVAWYEWFNDATTSDMLILSRAINKLAGKL
jgi:hypothetical protein